MALLSLPVTDVVVVVHTILDRNTQGAFRFFTMNAKKVLTFPPSTLHTGQTTKNKVTRFVVVWDGRDIFSLIYGAKRGGMERAHR